MSETSANVLRDVTPAPAVAAIDGTSPVSQDTDTGTPTTEEEPVSPDTSTEGCSEVLDAGQYVDVMSHSPVIVLIWILARVQRLWK